MILTAVRRYGLLVLMLVLTGCTQVSSLINTSTGTTIPPADFAFVDAGKIQIVNVSGEVTATAVSAADALPAVSIEGTHILYVEQIGEKNQLVDWQTDNDQSELISPLAGLPTQLEFSADEDTALIVVDQQLYLIFLLQHRLVRVHEGVEQAKFSDSNQRVEYRTTDQRLLSREFAVDGSLADAKALASDPFADLVIEERPNTRVAGWSKHGLGVYYVDVTGAITLVQYE